MNFSLRDIIIGIVVLTLAVAIPVTVRLAQEQQKLKSEAGTQNSFGFSNNGSTNPPGTRITINYSSVNVSGVKFYWLTQALGTCSDNVSCFNQTCNTGNCLGWNFIEGRENSPDGTITWVPPVPSDIDPSRSVTVLMTEYANPANFLHTANLSFAAPSPPPAGVDAATCGSITIDGRDITAPGSIVVNQPHNAQITMNHPRTSDGFNVRSWDSSYSLNYYGNDAGSLGLSTNQTINIRSGVIVSGTSQYTFSVDFTPTQTGLHDFYWEMRNGNNQQFGGQCTPQFPIVSVSPPPPPPPPPPSNVCSGSAGFIAGANRVWRCVQENSDGNPPQGCVTGSGFPDLSRPCSDNKVCYPCLGESGITQQPTITNFSANPTTVDSEQEIVLTWSVSTGTAAATNCSASGSWSGSKSVSGGSEVVEAPTVTSRTTKHYILTCTNTLGSDTEDIPVVVNPGTTTGFDFEVIPPSTMTITKGQSGTQCGVGQPCRGSVTVNKKAGTAQAVTLSTNLDTGGAEPIFTPESCTPTNGSCVSTLTFNATGANVRPGTYSPTIQGVSGGITRTSADANRAFTLTINQSPATVTCFVVSEKPEIRDGFLGCGQNVSALDGIKGTFGDLRSVTRNFPLSVTGSSDKTLYARFLKLAQGESITSCTDDPTKCRDTQAGITLNASSIPPPPPPGGPPPPPDAACPYNSTEVKFRNADNTGSWLGVKTIQLGQGVLVAGFHNNTTDSIPTDINLSVSGPQGFSQSGLSNGDLFTPEAGVGTGGYVFTATTIGSTGSKCSDTSTLTVSAISQPPPPTSDADRASCSTSILNRDSLQVITPPISSGQRLIFRVNMTNQGENIWGKDTYKLKASADTLQQWGLSKDTFKITDPESKNKNDIRRNQSVVFDIPARASEVSAPSSQVFKFNMVNAQDGEFSDACISQDTLVNPAPPPSVGTACFFMDDKPISKTSCFDEGAGDYSSHPMVVPQTLTGSGRKTIFVRFISNLGAQRDFQRVINFKPDPKITEADCTHSPSGTGSIITITGTALGAQGRGKVKVGGSDAEIITWNQTTGVVSASLDKRIEGRNDIELTRDDGKTARGECSIGITSVVFAAQTQCKTGGNFSADNVSVKIFANVPAAIDAEKSEPVIDQKVRLDKDGKPAGFTPKLEKNKKYSLIVKALGTLAKRVDFETKGGTRNLDTLILPAGDIAPSSNPDGRINAFDKSELIRQWSLITDVVRSGDLNGDSRVNSIDYACMRQNINKSDEEFSPPTVPESPVPAVSPTATPTATPTPTASPGTSPSPTASSSPTSSPTASPSPSPSSPPAGGTGGTPFRVSFNPSFPGGQTTEGNLDEITSEALIDLILQSPGQNSVYVQFFENSAWGPVPPKTASIQLM